jgi:hypothetical protein
MKFLSFFLFGYGLLLAGCETRPSIEKQTHDAYEERSEIKARNDFVRTLKPDQTPAPAPQR